MEPLQGTKIVITQPKDDLSCNAKHAFRTICGTSLDTHAQCKTANKPHTNKHIPALTFMPRADIPHSRAATVLVGFVQALMHLLTSDLWHFVSSPARHEVNLHAP